MTGHLKKNYEINTLYKLIHLILAVGRGAEIYPRGNTFYPYIYSLGQFLTSIKSYKLPILQCTLKTGLVLYTLSSQKLCVCVCVS